MECPFAAPEESQTELIQPEELIEDLLQELGSKTSELYQAQEQICKLGAEAQVLRKMRPGNEDGNMAYLSSVELKHFSGVQVQAAIIKWELKIRTTVAGKPFGRYQVETDSDKANSSNGPITAL
ncbi:unnamed protein product [Albugo candida]|uniref:Uncharacterized protein n=1 Tax=Albugo candida TaxID=65357 RepID=A0A024FSS9_9STRA|nr:unnamed protein product [Albugo candida]|eukprot:CCI10048.1 unnamed protein product [Albugo candida]